MVNDRSAGGSSLAQPTDMNGLEYPDDSDMATSQEAQSSRWRHVILMLNVDWNSRGNALSVTTSRRFPAARNEISHATIRILDRPSPTSAVISWRDPTGSSYGYQIWKMRLAHEEGLCAISGIPINKGDVIFRPVDRGRYPGNASAMILATYIEEPNCWLNALLRET